MPPDETAILIPLIGLLSLAVATLGYLVKRTLIGRPTIEFTDLAESDEQHVDQVSRMRRAYLEWTGRQLEE
jgi:hypothetical protein